MGTTGGAVGCPAGWCNVGGRRERGVVHLDEGELGKNLTDGDSRWTNLHTPTGSAGYGRVAGARHVAVRDVGRGDIGDKTCAAVTFIAILNARVGEAEREALLSARQGSVGIGVCDVCVGEDTGRSVGRAWDGGVPPVGD